MDNKNSVCIALGFFDGLHIGHKSLLKSLLSFCDSNNYKSAVFTFHNDFHFKCRNKETLLLLSEEERYNKLIDIGVDKVIFASPSEFFSNMTGKSFEEYLLKALNLKGIFVGKNFRYGKDASNDASDLQSFCLNNDIYCHIESDKLFENEIVSSSRIRNCLLNGDIEMANTLLGEHFSITGLVIKGRGLGSDYGFNTANLSFNKDVLIPKSGVYSTETFVDKSKYTSITHIGPRPTFDLEEFSFETHLINKEIDLYGKQITIQFIKRIRDTIKFKNSNELKLQIAQDIKKL